MADTTCGNHLQYELDAQTVIHEPSHTTYTAQYTIILQQKDTKFAELTSRAIYVRCKEIPPESM